jgi:isopropylmalate/homocitrate/citramalate synthase
MTDLPKHVDIHEEGPREGFQIEPGPISTNDKIKLIEALAETGLHHIKAISADGAMSQTGRTFSIEDDRFRLKR